MISPLEGGGRRRYRGFGRPAVEQSFSTRTRRTGRLGVLLLAAALLALAGWLAFGAADAGERGPAGGGKVLGGERPAATRAPGRDGDGRGDDARPDAAAIALPASSSDEIRLTRPPRAGILLDVDSGDVLWHRAANDSLPVASLTKIMSALLVVDRARPRERVRVTREAIDFSGSAVGLPKGRRVEVEPLLNAMLVQSGNDAATALAIGVAGSERRFVDLMNEHARRLGLDCTRFVSPDGLEPGNRSCAADLAGLSRLAMDEPRIRRVVRQEKAIVRAPVPGGKLHLATTNPLLESGYPGTVGLKTGYTERAGRCFVAVVRRDGRTLAAVLIDSRDPGRDARALFAKALGGGSRG